MRGRHLSFLAVVALTAATAALGVAEPAFAAPPAVLYVDNTPGGNCSDGGGGTQGQPYCTVSAAVSAVVPGQTIDVSGASYAEHVTIGVSGLSGQPITIRSRSGAALTGANGGLTITGQHDIVIDDLDAKPSGAVVGVDVSDSTRITLKGIAVGCVTTTSTAAQGIRLTGVTDSVVTGAQTCAVGLDATTSGVQVRTIQIWQVPEGRVGIDVAGSNNSITNVLFTPPCCNGGVSGTGIRLEPGAADNVVADNALDDQRVGIDNDGATGTAITNNTLNRACTGIRVAGASSHVSVQNNVVSDNRILTNSCPGSAVTVDIGVWDDAVRDTVVDYNNVVCGDGLRHEYAWQTPMDSLAAFHAASGQGAHDLEDAPSTWSVDSANSAAPGFPSTDNEGHAREDDPAVPDTGAGPITYADRGATELVQGPDAMLTVTADQDAMSVRADASATRPGWLPLASYAFNFGDDTPVVTQTGPVATHTYATEGTYTVSVIVTDTNGVSLGTVATTSLWHAVRSVALLSDADNRYVTAEGGGTQPLIANRSSAGAWEQFDLVQPDATHMALRARVNGKYLGLDGNQRLSYYSDSTNAGTLFQLVPNADGTVSMLWNGTQYVTAENAGAQPLIANRSAIGLWERFNVVDLANTSVSLRAHANGRYVTAESGGSGPLIANRTAVGPWEQFDLVDAGGGYVALYSHANGRFVTAEAGGTRSLIANRTAIGAWERFTVVRNADGSVSLVALADARYVTAESGGSRPLIANRSAVGLWEEFDLSR